MWDKLPVELWIHIIFFAENPVKLLTCSKFFLKFVPLLQYYNKFIHTKFKKNRSKNILKIAVENGFINVVKHIDNLKRKNSILVQNPWIFGYDVGILFDICCKKGHLDLIKYIFHESVCYQHSKDIHVKIWDDLDTNNVKYLISAISHGRYDVSLYLLKNVVKLDWFQIKYVIHTTIKYRQYKIFRLLFRGKILGKSIYYALKVACRYGSLKIVKYLVKKKNAKIETDNYFAIDIALSNNHYRTVKYLLSTLLEVKIPVYWTWLDVMNDLLGYHKDNDNIKNIMSRSNNRVCDNSLVFLNLEEITYKNINELFIGQKLNAKQHKNIIDLYISNYKNKKDSDENQSREHLYYIIKHLMENMELDSIKYIISETKFDPLITNFIHKQSLEINSFDTTIFM
ncbi:putative ankyrin repeat protein [Acanthamoeba polyphaga mimivirus]|uniref:Ankyrin repeat protein n=1 Tax=Acanthamoeba polyphaga mimivirus Kroon TaxID=3069720 RepID=A0A0G2Y7P4_9VIRU|nr:putative ankyrin repeat protein [Acanthamoeba polyphaga mimivirus]AKI79842.1 putative ankyrin repeat protein [Acanthamoeba polyphaga mimivirus Kroon]